MTTPAESYDSPIKGIFYLVAGVFVFSIQDVIIKSLSGKYPVNEIVIIRSCIAIIPILFIAHLEGGTRCFANETLFYAYNSQFLHVWRLYFLLFIHCSTSGWRKRLAYFISTPIFITIFAVIALGEKVEIRSWIAVVVGFIGVIIMLRPGSNMFDPAALLALLTAVLYAIASIITPKVQELKPAYPWPFTWQSCISFLLQFFP